MVNELGCSDSDDSYNYGDWLELVRNGWTRIRRHIKRCPPLALVRALFCYVWLDSISFIIIFDIFSFLYVTQ